MATASKRQGLSQPTVADPIPLSNLVVDQATYDKLGHLIALTGASGAWHRRRALIAYLDAEIAKHS